MNSKNAEDFKENPNLYSAYLTGVQDAAEYLSQHQVTRVRFEC